MSSQLTELKKCFGPGLKFALPISLIGGLIGYFSEGVKEGVRAFCAGLFLLLLFRAITYLDEKRKRQISKDNNEQSEDQCV